MSPELIGIIAVGVSIGALLLVSLNRMEKRLGRQINDLRTDHNARMDSIEARLLAIERGQTEVMVGQAELKSVVSDHTARFDSVDARFDSIDSRLRTVEQSQIELKSGQSELRNIATDHTSRLDLIDERLRAVERGHSEILGSVNTMNQVVLATLQRQIEGEPVGAD